MKNKVSIFDDDMGSDEGQDQIDGEGKEGKDNFIEPKPAEKDNEDNTGDSSNNGGDDVFGKDPGFGQGTKKKKKEPSEAIADLRRDRDLERVKNKAFTDVFGSVDPSTIKTLFDYVSSSIEGPISADAVSSLVQDLGGSRKSIEELQTAIQEKERVISELDIKSSSEFKNKFEKPYAEAMEGLFLEFANVGEDDKIIAPKATSNLNEAIVSNLDITGVQMKSMIAKYVKEYREESGEDPVIPSVSSLMSGVRTLKKAKEGLQEAYSNWGELKKKTKQQQEDELKQQSITAEREAARRRKDLVSKAYQNFDSDSTPFLEPKQVQDLFREEYSYYENIVSNRDVPEYDVLIGRGISARLWEMNKDEFVQLKKMKEDLEKSERSGISNNNSSGVPVNSKSRSSVFD